MSKCYLWNKCKQEHEKANPMFTEKLYFVGKLFKSPICVHCVLRLSRLAESTPTDNSVMEMEAYKAKHPEYAAVLDEIGIDTLRFELKKSIVEANPDNTPTRPEQVEDYPKLEVEVD